MTDIRNLCDEIIGKELYQIIISNPQKQSDISKVKIRPIMLKNTIVFQVTEYKGAQVFHENYDKGQLLAKIEDYLQNNFKQMELTATNIQATVLISKKGKVTVKKKSLQTEKKVDLSILRLAICELIFIEEIPNKVSINEAIELSKKYSDEKVTKLINGVLDKINYKFILYKDFGQNKLWKVEKISEDKKTYRHSKQAEKQSVHNFRIIFGFYK